MSVVAIISFCSSFFITSLLNLWGVLHHAPQLYSPPCPPTPLIPVGSPNGNDILTLNCKVTKHKKAHHPKYVFPSKTTNTLWPQQPIFLSLSCFQALISNWVDILIPYPAILNDSRHPIANLCPFIDSLLYL